MYAINNHEVSQSDMLAAMDAIEDGVSTYIRPVYRNGWFIGFAVYRDGEALGKVFPDYKQAALLLTSIRSEA